MIDTMNHKLRMDNEVKKTKMRPELEIVFLSACPRSPGNEERIKQLCGAGANWSEVLACAIEHKLTVTLYEAVRALDKDLVPQDKRDALAEIARITTRDNFRFLSEMLRLHALFESARIPAIPFKGPSLAWVAYPNFAQRTCADLDFVVPQRYIPEIVRLLKANKYIPQFSIDEAQAGQHGPVPGQYAFAPIEKSCYLELHTERTLRYFSHPLNLEEMNSRLLQLDIAGQNLRTFSVEDLLIMLSVHGAKHFWDRLSWIFDIAQLITVREVNWDLLLQIAVDMECTRVLFLGLYLAHELFGAVLPQPVLEQLRRDKNVQWLANKVLEGYTGDSRSTIGVWPRAIFRFRSSDRYSKGLRHLVRLAMSPTESDRQTINLPRFLNPFYGVWRPLRLMREYGLGLMNRRAKTDLAIFIPTSHDVVEQMLCLAEVGPGDVLYDLGCGDGRIVVTAAKKYGIRTVGVDINPTRIAEARANARQNEVEDLVQFILGDAKQMDFREATVITMYLGADGNLRLVDQLRSQLRPGARIVSRDFQIYGWEPERNESYFLPNGDRTSLYLWTIKSQEPVSPGTTGVVSGASNSR